MLTEEKSKNKAYVDRITGVLKSHVDNIEEKVSEIDKSNRNLLEEKASLALCLDVLFLPNSLFLVQLRVIQEQIASMGEKSMKQSLERMGSMEARLAKKLEKTEEELETERERERETAQKEARKAARQKAEEEAEQRRRREKREREEQERLEREKKEKERRVKALEEQKKTKEAKAKKEQLIRSSVESVSSPRRDFKIPPPR